MNKEEKDLLISLLNYHEKWREQLQLNIRDGHDASDLMWKVEAYKKTVLEFEGIMSQTTENE